MRPIRVAIIDRSMFMRAMLRKAFIAPEQFEIVGSAQDATRARELIAQEKPDVVTLDLDIPGGGMEVLNSLGEASDTAVVVVSAPQVQSGADASMAALEAGAVAVVAKPEDRQESRSEVFFEQVRAAVRGACGSRRTNRPETVRQVAGDLPTDVVVAIGISAGGPQTLHKVLPHLRLPFPPVVITQHMPAGFTAAFAERLDQKCALRVEEATEGRKLEPGVILIAPGDAHLRVERKASSLCVKLSRGPKVSGFRPSVDAMFDSLAQVAAERTVAVVMTGMGSDGATGIRLLKQKGARTLSQDEQTSVVYGMPKAAFETGSVDEVFSLPDLPLALAGHIRQQSARPGG